MPRRSARSGRRSATRASPGSGLFLRKTRLDELPQLINVLQGDMAIIGPRPERPGFYQKLERSIPFFADRTAGIRPGITGLAQVNQGYDTCLEDVRNKAAFDHAYAMALRDLRAWFCQGYVAGAVDLHGHGDRSRAMMRRRHFITSSVDHSFFSE